ncbi:hypothetical protein HanPSC8_Chr17g0784311 [Helianthus annuus]|nr:hypothetical protein HanPSC8_Chr17g0784311 [Helianthus annuus]
MPPSTPTSPHPITPPMPGFYGYYSQPPFFPPNITPKHTSEHTPNPKHTRNPKHNPNRICSRNPSRTLF